jgi:N-acyl-L-homoserine lactone synthetase
MIQLITADRYGAFFGDVAEMHRLRYRIFKERLGWDVQGIPAPKAVLCEAAFV